VAVLFVLAWPFAALAADEPFLVGDPQVAAGEKPILRGAWDLFEPYQFIEDRNGYPYLTGLDIELLRAIADTTGYRLSLDKVPWRQHVEEVATGERDFALAAVRTPERERFAYFSVPYRQESVTLILPRGRTATLAAKSPVELVRLLKAQRLRLGVVDGFAYPNAAVREFIADPKNAPLIVVAANEHELLNDLLGNRIDGFLADRIAVATVAWRRGLQNEIEEHPVVARRDVRRCIQRGNPRHSSRRNVPNHQQALYVPDPVSANFG
jgi:polar amino acid transport system substrate-binding protein